MSFDTVDTARDAATEATAAAEEGVQYRDERDHSIFDACLCVAISSAHIGTSDRGVKEFADDFVLPAVNRDGFFTFLLSRTLANLPRQIDQSHDHDDRANKLANGAQLSNRHANLRWSVNPSRNWGMDLILIGS